MRAICELIALKVVSVSDSEKEEELRSTNRMNHTPEVIEEFDDGFES